MRFYVLAAIALASQATAELSLVRTPRGVVMTYEEEPLVARHLNLTLDARDKVYPDDQQYGTNNCGTKASPSAKCDNIYLNSIEDFCLWGPPTVDPVGDAEGAMVSYCLKGGHGSRLIPKGTFKSLHLVRTADYVQLTGTGDFTKVDVKAGDAGGELDPHGYTGLGNPVKGKVYGVDKNGTPNVQFTQWSQFIGDDLFCIRACWPSVKGSGVYCPHIYDEMGCQWNFPGQYGSGFSTCKGDNAKPPGTYTSNGHTYTFTEGQAYTPPGPPTPKSSSCTTWKSLTYTTYAS